MSGRSGINETSFDFVLINLIVEFVFIYLQTALGRMCCISDEEPRRIGGINEEELQRMRGIKNEDPRCMGGINDEVATSSEQALLGR